MDRGDKPRVRVDFTPEEVTQLVEIVNRNGTNRQPMSSRCRCYIDIIFFIADRVEVESNDSVIGNIIL